MRANDIFKESLKLAEQFAKDINNVPKLFDSVLSDILPNLSDDEKIKLQQLVKESNKLIDNAKKTGDFVNIKESIDELNNKYGRNYNT